MRIADNNRKYKELVKNKLTLGSSLNVKNPIINSNDVTIPIVETISGAEASFDFKIEWDEPGIAVTLDMVAYLVARLVGKKYIKINFSFDIYQATLDNITTHTEAEITANSVLPGNVDYSARKNYSVNVSGGMDSVALAKLLNEASDFTVKFSCQNPRTDAENDYAKVNIPTTLVRSNIGEEPWVVMHDQNAYFNIGSLLFSDKVGLKLAANGMRMTEIVIDWDKIINPVGFDGVAEGINWEQNSVYGVNTVYPFAGFMTMGVLKLMYKLDPDFYGKIIVDDVTSRYLENIMTPRNINRPHAAMHRYLLDSVVTGEFREGLDPSKITASSFKWANFYSWYLLKKLGADVLKKYLSDVPEFGEVLVANLSLDFMEKYDQNMLNILPDDFRTYFESKLKAAGVEFYTDRDYEERAIFIKIMLNN